MRIQLLAMAAAGSLMAGTAMAQTSGTAGAGAITQEDVQELQKAFEQAGFSGFEAVAGGQAFRGMSADRESAIIAIAPDNATGSSGASTGASGGMADGQVYRVTTGEGRTLLIVLAPGDNMSGNADTAAGGTTTTTADTAASSTAGTTTAGTETQGASETETAASGTTSGTTASGTTTDTASGSSTGSNNAAADNAASEEKVEVTIELEGSQQVPPVDTEATGKTAVSFDPETRTLTWELSYSGLSGEATAAHFHGPADPGENAPPVVPMEETASGSDGSAELTEDQAEQLMDGKWYVNVHTADHPNGEIRGQVVVKQ